MNRLFNYYEKQNRFLFSCCSYILILLYAKRKWQFFLKINRGRSQPLRPLVGSLIVC